MGCDARSVAITDCACWPDFGESFCRSVRTRIGVGSGQKGFFHLYRTRDKNVSIRNNGVESGGAVSRRFNVHKEDGVSTRRDKLVTSRFRCVISITPLSLVSSLITPQGTYSGEPAPLSG